MKFTLVLGPMKSGKTLELISRLAPYQLAGKSLAVLHPTKNTRDTGVVSRSGLSVEALPVNSLSDYDGDVEVIGVDEINMFDEKDSEVVKQWLADGKEVVISGLDLDYRGKFIPIVSKLWELKPDELIIKEAVCDVCHSLRAQYSQILTAGKPITEGLALVTPEDGTYEYQARCREHFVAPE